MLPSNHLSVIGGAAATSLMFNPPTLSLYIIGPKHPHFLEYFLLPTKWGLQSGLYYTTKIGLFIDCVKPSQMKALLKPCPLEARLHSKMLNSVYVRIMSVKYPDTLTKWHQACTVRTFSYLYFIFGTAKEGGYRLDDKE